MDFGKTENIIFVAVSAAFAVFLFVSFFILVARKKNKLTGFDIALRIISIIVFVAYLALFVLAVFTELSGSFRIEAGDEKALFIIGDSVTELPLAPIFKTLTTLEGQTIVGAVAVMALVVFITDLIAVSIGKKRKTEKRPAQKKSPEQIKRAAEIERIRRLADAAVKKT